MLGVGLSLGLSEQVRVKCQQHGLELLIYSVRLRGPQVSCLLFPRLVVLPLFSGLAQILSCVFSQLCLCALVKAQLVFF